MSGNRQPVGATSATPPITAEASGCDQPAERLAANTMKHQQPSAPSGGQNTIDHRQTEGSTGAPIAGDHCELI